MPHPHNGDETGPLTTSSMQQSMLPAAVDDIEAAIGANADAAAPTLSDVTAPDPIYRRTSAQLAPCGMGRCAASIGGVLVPGLCCVTIVPFVFQHPYLPAWWAIADVTIFFVLLALLLTSW